MLKMNAENEDAKKTPKEIVNVFLSERNCSEIPEIKDCEQLRNQFKEELKGGCSPCKRRGLNKKYTQLIMNRL
ncbi:hypothetical protein CL634_10120 [bacterium]|nr:hypothetical protein [bacterium]